MRRGVGVIAVIGALVAAGCASEGAATTEPTAPPPTAFATVPAPSTSAGGSDGTAATGTRASEGVDATIASSPILAELLEPSSGDGAASASTSMPSDDVPVDVAPAEADPDPGPVLDEVDADEPTFDIGPPVDLDVDLVRFPVDDAGQGGTPIDDPPAGGDEGPVDGEEPPEVVTGWAAFDRYLEATLIRPGNTAASVAVSIGGDVVHAAAFGIRDPAAGDPAEPADRFRIASISKPITAIVALTLVESGLVALDAPIGQTIAGHIGAPVARSTGALTLRQLLTHRSGFGKYESAFFRGGATDCVDVARSGLASGVSGGGYTYSNMNYCLIGLLIEAVTGLSYEQAVYQQLLTPLGISGMRLPPTVDPGPDEIQHRTTPGRNYMETLEAAGAWVATPTDLVTIFDALDLATPGFKPLSQQSVFEMVVPAGASYGQRGYGLGVISYGDGRFGHTGTIESTHAMLLNRGDGVTWALTVAGSVPSESTDLERIMNQAFEAGGFVSGG